MSRKAIKIDLSIFFDDERKYCCILVDPNWKRVACLQERLQHLFDIDCIRLLNDGCFLPPQESIEIIQFCNDIKAFVPEKFLKKKKKASKKSKNIKKSSEESGNEETGFVDCDLINDTKSKRKCNSLGSSHCLNNFASQAKRSKGNNDNAILELVQNADKEIGNKNSKSKQSKALMASLCNDVSTLQNQSHKQKSEITENPSNSKQNTFTALVGQHKEHQTSTPKDDKSSEISENKIFNDEIITDRQSRSGILSSTFLNESKILNPHSHVLKNPFRKSKSSGAHIYFNETGETISSTIKKTPAQTNDKDSRTVVIFRCPLSEITNGKQPQKPRIFHLKSVNTNATKKQTVEIQEDIILPSIQFNSNVSNEISLDKGENDTNEIEKQKETNETTKAMNTTNAANENSSLHSSTIVRDTTTVSETIIEEVSATESTVTNVTGVDQKSQIHRTNDNEASILSANCVDLSMDLEEDNSVVQKNETTELTLNENPSESYDLTRNNESTGNGSSESDIEEISEVIDLNETEDYTNTSTFQNIVSQQNIVLNDLQVDTILAFSTELTHLPNVGDIIAFKVPYLNNNKKLVTTDFIAGKVEYVNKRAKTMKILIIDGDLELRYVPNQLQYNLDDSQDGVKYLQLKLNDMVDPKKFSKP